MILGVNCASTPHRSHSGYNMLIKTCVGTRDQANEHKEIPESEVDISVQVRTIQGIELKRKCNDISNLSRYSGINVASPSMS